MAEVQISTASAVAPRMGAWIETKIGLLQQFFGYCRAPHGRVD